MNVPAVVIPTASRNHIAVLEYFCDDIARRRPALADIFAALRSQITGLADTINAAPAWCDYLAVRKLSEFPEAPNHTINLDTCDEPLFTHDRLIYLTPRLPVRRDVFFRNSLLFAPHRLRHEDCPSAHYNVSGQWRRSLLIACESERSKQEPDKQHYVRPIKFRPTRSVEWRSKHSAMGKLMSLYAEVTEKMRGDEEADHYAKIEELSYKQALCYLRACSRWLTEKKMSGKQARALNDILSESRTFPN